jgi:urease gamma subunit
VQSELQKAFDEAAKLPDNEQEALGQWLLEEIASERRWDELFLRSPEKLAALAKKALEEHRAGRTQDLDPDKL